jgi:hypothetical protein
MSRVYFVLETAQVELKSAPSVSPWQEADFVLFFECPLETMTERLLERGRGLHSFPSQLNLRALYGIGSARSACVARVKGVSGGVQGV